MALPSAPLARGTEEVAGETLAIRSLTRAEMLHLLELKGQPDANRQGEVWMIACGMDVSAEEAAAWWDASDAIAVQKLVLAVARVSRIEVADGKDPKPPQSANSSKAR